MCGRQEARKDRSSEADTTRRGLRDYWRGGHIKPRRNRWDVALQDTEGEWYCVSFVDESRARTYHNAGKRCRHMAAVKHMLLAMADHVSLTTIRGECRPYP